MWYSKQQLVMHKSVHYMLIVNIQHFVTRYIPVLTQRKNQYIYIYIYIIIYSM